MDDAIISMVTGTKTKTRIAFDYIVHVNHSPKSVARFNPILPVHKKPMIKKKLAHLICGHEPRNLLLLNHRLIVDR